MEQNHIPHQLNLRMTVSVGPGPYVEDLVHALAAEGLLDRVIYSWPDLRVLIRDTQSGHLQTQYQADWFRHFVRYVWGAWRMLPGIGRSEHPRLWVDKVYDRVASRHIGSPEIFLGWSQVSLHTMKVAKQKGATVVLEHPMLHVDEWQRLIPEECKKWGVDPLECYSVVPDDMADRMRQEYDIADRIMTPSRAAVDSFVSSGTAPEKMLNVHFGVDTEMFHPMNAREEQPKRPFRVLYVGRLELLKGLPYLLEAWQVAKLEDAELLLVGRRLPEIEPVLQKYASDNVRVMKEVPRNQLPALYNNADVLVFPTLCDGFGIVMLEAMACGLPVIATTNCGGSDCIKEGMNGFLVPICNSRTIAEKLQSLHQDPVMAGSMRAAGRQMVEKYFKLKDYQHNLVECYRGLLSSKNNSPA